VPRPTACHCRTVALLASKVGLKLCTRSSTRSSLLASRSSRRPAGRRIAQHVDDHLIADSPGRNGALPASRRSAWFLDIIPRSCRAPTALEPVPRPPHCGMGLIGKFQMCLGSLHFQTSRCDSICSVSAESTIATIRSCMATMMRFLVKRWPEIIGTILSIPLAFGLAWLCGTPFPW
jgi:hypothetical protein